MRISLLYVLHLASYYLCEAMETLASVSSDSVLLANNASVAFKENTRRGESCGLPCKHIGSFAPKTSTTKTHEFLMQLVIQAPDTIKMRYLFRNTDIKYSILNLIVTLERQKMRNPNKKISILPLRTIQIALLTLN